MIKLLPFEDFMKHPMFVGSEGLCTNLNRVYHTGDIFQIYPAHHLMNYCALNGIDRFYPIKTGSCSGQDLYLYSKINNCLYKDAQFELRKQLYTNVINWMAKHYHKEYTLCTN